jgi:hypothetical protein
LGNPGRGASHVKKITRLNWATQFLTVAYDGAYSQYFCQNGLALQKKKKLDDSSRLDVVEISRVA